jgi:hypothetical protein
MNILSYFNIIVNIGALLFFIIYKASYFFDFLINAPYFIQLKKGFFPVQACPRPDRGKDPLTYLYIKLLFVKLIKLVIISIRIYKDIPHSN